LVKSISTSVKSKSQSLGLELILSARHYDPFSFLGLHAIDDAEHAYVLRTFIAAASKVSVQTGKAWVELKKTHPDGLFESR